MPFCSQCGTQVESADRFCGKCGGAQQSDYTKKDSRAQNVSEPSGYSEDDRRAQNVGEPSGRTENDGHAQHANQPGRDGHAQQSGRTESANPRQGTPPPFGQTYPSSDPFSNMSARNFSLLCYIPWFGWIGSIIVLASQRFKTYSPENRTVRFHAFQGLYLFVAWLLVDWVIAPMLTFSRFVAGAPRGLGALAHLLILAAWILMLVKTANGERYRLPIIGDLAESAVDEQRT